MRVYVLCTGRCGSMTFAKACEHMTNYTVGHESRKHTLANDKLNYPDNHIEVDNRLSWMLGSIPEEGAVYYVWLKRDPIAVARSYTKRWEHKNTIIRAYADAILGCDGSLPTRYDIALDMVHTINANIENFVVKRPHSTIIMEGIWQTHEWLLFDFKRFWRRIGAEGDIDAAVAELDKRYNASRGGE